MTKYKFRASEFMSAREKELVLRAWVRFLKNGLRLEDFSDRLYKHLTLHCSFIAHYNRGTFYLTYFDKGEDTVRFLSQFDNRGDCQSVEYGGTVWKLGEYEDLAKAMIEEASPYIPKLMEKALAEQRQSDLATAERLAAKHGVELDLTK
jgi:hypothetical protein